MDTAPLKAAIIGASGIGKHHAKWLHALGADVCAIVSRSAENAARTAAGLREIFPFTGGLYTSLPEMLAEADPDLVHVCSPPHLHHEHVLALANHRCHVLCEKPLTWDADKSSAQLLAEAAAMVTAVSQPGRVSATNLQYAAVPAAYAAHAQAAGWPAEAPTEFFMRLDSRRDRNIYEIIWRELSPHCLSVLMAFCGPGTVDYDTVVMTIGERLCEAGFIYQPQSGPACRARLEVGCTPEGPLPRRFGINGLLVDYEGRNDAAGVYRTYLSGGGVETASDDFMYLSMRQMVRAATGEAERPLATLAEGRQNQEMQLEIVARGTRVE